MVRRSVLHGPGLDEPFGPVILRAGDELLRLIRSLTSHTVSQTHLSARHSWTWFFRAVMLMVSGLSGSVEQMV